MTEVVTSNSGTSTTPSVTVPSNAAAKTAVLLGLFTTNATDSDATITAAMPAGFELILAAGTQAQGTRGRILLFAKRMTGADSGSYTLGTLTSAYWEIAAVGITGLVTVGKLWNALYASTVGAASGATTQSNNGVTPGASSAKVYAWASNSNGGNWTPPSGFTEDYDTGARLELVHLTTGQAATTGSYTTTCSVGGYMRSLIIALSADDHVDTASVANYVFASTAAQTPALPAHEPGQRITYVVSGKSETMSQPSFTSGWTLVGSTTGGTGSAGADTGQLSVFVWQRDVVAGESSSSGTPIADPTVTPGGTAPNTWMAEISVAAPSTGKVMRDAIGASADYVKFISDTDAATSVTGGTAAAMTNQPTTGDAVHVFGCFPTDAMTTCTALVASASGLSDGTVAGLPTAVNTSTPQTTQSVSVFNRTTLGNDMAMAFFDWVEFNGTASSGITASITHNAGNQSGIIVVVAHRQQAGGTTVSGGTVTETDTAVAGATTVGAVIAGGMATSTASIVAGAVLVGALVVGGQATETSSVQAGSVVTGQIIVGGQATETNTVVGGSVAGGAVVAGGQAVETDTAQAGAIAQTIVGGTAAETDTALGGTVRYVVPGGTATETDTIVGGTVSAGGTVITGGQAVETDSVVGGTVIRSWYATRTWNRAGGRARTGHAYWDYDPPLPATPSGRTTVGAVRPMAQAFNGFTRDEHNVVNGLADLRKIHGTGLTVRIVIDHQDLTRFRGRPTPLPDWQYIEPIGYGPAVFTFETIHAGDELGADDLDWCYPDAPAKIQLVDTATHTVHSTVWRGQLDDLDFSSAGGSGGLTVWASGLWSGEAALRDMQQPLFGGRADIGRIIAHLAESSANVRFIPKLGPETGIVVNRFGGVKHLEGMNMLFGWARTLNKGPYTVLPQMWGTNKFELVEKNLETIDGTVFIDGDRTTASLRRQRAAEPDQIFGRGTTPGGQRVRNGRYPGVLDDPDETITAPPYPFDDDRSFGLGTTNDDTDTGDGISVMLTRLQTYGWLDREDITPGTFTEPVEEAVRRLKDRAGIVETSGNMTVPAWRALYNVDRIGQSEWWAKIEPMAQADWTIKWDTSADGSILAKHDGWEGDVRRRVDKTNDYGAGWTKAQMIDFSERDLEDGQTPNWFGEVQFGHGGLLRGDVDPGTPVTDADFMDALEVRTGMNLRLVYTSGGDIVVHVGQVFNEGSSNSPLPVAVTANVDTRMRDSAPLYELIAGGRAARQDTRRIWWQQNRASGQVKDSIVEFDEVGGQLNPVTVPGGAYKVFKVLAGQMGLIEQVKAITSGVETEFVLAFFGLPIGETKLASVCPDPLSDKQGWIDSMNDLDDTHRLLYLVGEPGDPAGYSPGSKSGGHDLTGRLVDQAGFPYRTGPAQDFRPWLYGVIYAADDCTLSGGESGRMLWNQEVIGS